MRLSKIKLSGFKSFVDPTTLHLPSQLTAIVGPNGCGKSNVIDAVRWVMGESSAKQLRGDSLQDVIFNGSSTRKSVGQAQVELVFDNHDGKLGGQFASFTEISIRREATRDGQSTYFLNGSRCRRKDIVDVFLGTGLGPRSYAIIEQGTISRIIEARPEELRHFLEEAAGISKYKERRHETEERIRHTEENLSRLNDIRNELERQIIKLADQKEKAAEYQALQTEERQLKTELCASRLAEIAAESERLQVELVKARQALESDNQRLEEIRKELKTSRDAQAVLQEAVQAAHGSYYEKQTALARCEEQMKHLNARAEDYRQEKTLLAHKQQELKIQVQQESEQLAAHQDNLNKLLPVLAEKEESYTLAQRQLLVCEEALRTKALARENHEKIYTELARDVEIKRAHIVHLDAECARLLAALVKDEEELASLTKAIDETSLQHLQELLASQEKVQLALDAQIQEQQQVLLAVKEAVKAQERTLKEAQATLQQTQTRLAGAQARQEATWGMQDKAVEAWLQEKNLNTNQRLGEVLQVDVGWEWALESVLEAFLRAPMVSSFKEVMASVSSLAAGTLTLVSDATTVAEPQSTTQLPFPALTEKVQATWPVGLFLKGVYAVPSLQDALSWQEQLQSHESLVTPAGEWVGRDWVRVFRPSSQDKQGLLARAREIRELEQALQELTAHVLQLETILAQEKNKEEEVERVQQALQHDLQKIQKTLNDTKALWHGQKAQFDAQVDRKTQALLRIEAQSARQDGLRKELIEERGHLEVLLEKMSWQYDACRVQKSQQEEQESSLKQARETVKTAMESLYEVRVRKNQAENASQSLTQNLKHTELAILDSEQRLQQLLESMEAQHVPLQELAGEQGILKRAVTELEVNLQERRKALEGQQEKIRTEETHLYSVEQALEQARVTVQELLQKEQTLALQEAQVRERVSAFDLDLSVVSDLPTEAKKSEEVLRRVERAIKALGAVNLAALQEYEQESLRKAHLDAEWQDITDALAMLREAMHKIDEETRTRFLETLEKVNGTLGVLFPRLFGGGEACLTLLEEDVLTSGVSIMARPPGKRNSTIHLLSGGEKALTAIAFVFGIFELNPAPFCLLDEVDAPLDDANVGRFAKLVAEMSARVQFVMITHNKNTMTVAEQLSGVTMYEPGVSRLVAVNVAEAVQLAGS